tara:strand:+ start:1120 stop:1344 length:225 start_codon:yes stop_codon:yes gene_type:complete
MIEMTRENMMMIATAVCLVGIIFLFKELNKTKEDINGFRTFSEQLVQHMNTPVIEDEQDEDEGELEKIEEKKEE